MIRKKKSPANSTETKSSKSKPRNLAPSGLSWKRDAFCLEYLKDRNATQAAIRAGYSERTAKEQGYRLLTNVHVKAHINTLMRERAKMLEIETTDVLQRLWEKATADVNELVRVERRCCRYCWGIEHEYQWKTAREFKEAQDSFLNELSQGDTDALLVLVQAMEDGRTIPGLPNEDGGYGFDASTNPWPDCPECHGEGIANVVIADTREALAHPLYEGLKQTQHGIEIKIADRAKALEQVARHLQMFKDEVEVSASEELLEAARTISAASPPISPEYIRNNAHRLDELE